MTLGRKLVEIRKERGFSQAVMAGLGGLSKDYLSQLENDEILNPSAGILLNLARGINLDPSVLFEAAGYEIPGQNRSGFLKIPVDLDLLSFCSRLSLKKQASMLGYLSHSYDLADESAVLPSSVKAKKISGRRRPVKKLGGVIRQLREQRGLSQGQLSKGAAISQGYLSQLESGR